MKKLTLFIISVLASATMIAQVSVKGVVTSDTGEPVAGAYVLVSGTTNGTVTGTDGQFELRANVGETLEISCLGMQSTSLVIPQKTDNIAVTMQTDYTTLDDVVVVGYGVTRKRDLAGSISQIKTDDVKAGVITSTAEMLRGRAAGVAVRQQSFEPGGGITVRVRGASSISSDNDPLYVVDGIQTTVGNQVAPEDIESIEILKDAAATAIYGARGANGVVIITTKKGQSGKVSIDYSYNIAVKVLKNPWDLMDAAETVQYEMKTWRDNGSAGDPPYTEEQQAYTGKGTDWIKELTSNSTTQTHAVGVSGGNDKVRAAATFVDINDKGILMNSKFHRLSARVNVDFNIRPWLRAGVNAYTAQTKKTYVSLGTNNSTDNAMYWMFLASPLTLDNGKNVFGEDTRMPTVYNELKYKDFLTTVNNTYVTVYGEADIYKHLTARVQYSFSREMDKYQKYYTVNTILGQSYNGLANQELEDVDYTQLEAYLTYSQTFGKHSLKVVAGTSRQENVYNYSGMEAHNFTTDAFSYNNMGAAGSVDWIATSKSVKTNISFFGRAEYIFNGKYIFNASVRADGASNFGKNNKWGIFPSASAAWQIGDEPFMEFTKPLFSSIKLRASWGQSGNDGIGNYKSLRTYSFNNVYLGGADVVKAMYPSNAGNSELKWETTTQTDIGLDFALLKNRIEVNFDWYNKITTDLLNPVNISSTTTGLTTTTGNNGKIQNRGFEFYVKYHVFDKKDFNWSMTFNISRNRNEVLNIDTPTYYTVKPHGSYADTQYAIIQKGLPLSTIYGYVWDGIIQEGETYSAQPKSQPGDPKFKDLDGDGVITDNDRKQIGKGDPDVVLGWGNTINWKNFDFTVFFDASIGNDLLNLTSVVLQDNDRLAICNDRWSKTNPSTKVIRGTYKRDGGLQYGSFVNSDNVENASFLRLSNIEIGYTLPLKKWGVNFIDNLRVFAGAQRLFTITGYSGFDPETSTNGSSAVTQGLDYNAYPSYRQFNFGAKITF